jgi:hypothetical protein
MNKNDHGSKVNTFDLGILQSDCEKTADNLRVAQDRRLEADLAFKQAQDEYYRAGKALETGLRFVTERCAVFKLIEN